MFTTVDEAMLNEAVQGTIEVYGNNLKQIRLRPNAPMAYYPSQGYSIVLRFDALDALLALAERNGYRRTP